MRIKVTDIDNTDKILAKLEEIDNSNVQVGIIADKGFSYIAGSGETATIYDIATVHEFGHMGKDKNGREMNIPERSFIRGTFDAHKNEIADKFAKLLVFSIEKDVPVETTLKTFGEYAAGLTREYITDISDPPNSPATIAAKGSSNPLIDTGKLRQSIDYKITKGGD